MASFESILKIVSKVPPGKVATYGQIAALAGAPRAARTVGWALHGLGDKIDTVPWHRVVNREGRISTTCLDHPAEYQVLFLRKEKIGVELRDGNYFVDLKRYLWSSFFTSDRSGPARRSRRR